MVREYERLRNISTGRFGAAFLIQASGRLAMMKTIDTGRLGCAARKEVLAEVGVFATLRHAHIAALHECFIEGGYICLVFQYADGGHAGGQIERARNAGAELGEALVMRWFTQSVLGLRYMHDRSVIHRDLRTRRLLLTSEGHVLLSCAAITPLLRASLWQERQDLEAVGYMSPELIAGEEHAIACDMWALGAILYELASLVPPFDHAHPRGLAERILAGPPRSLPVRCSGAVRSLCAGLMKRQPGERLTTTDILRQPDIQERVVKLFSEEPTLVPGARQPSSSTPSQKAAAGPARNGSTPRKGSFGPLLPRSPVVTPRGLRRVGEHVTGVKCGALGITGTTTLRGPKAKAPNTVSESLVDGKGIPGSNAGKESPEILDHLGTLESKQQLTNELADEHAKLYAGIMVQSALEDLNFASSRLLEEDIRFDRWSLPVCVDIASGATWDVNSEVCGTDSQGSHRWDRPPPQHTREFPRFG